jgi:hypothetical protein
VTAPIDQARAVVWSDRPEQLVPSPVQEVTLINLFNMTLRIYYEDVDQVSRHFFGNVFDIFERLLSYVLPGSSPVAPQPADQTLVMVLSTDSPIF